MTEFSPREIVSELDRFVVGHAEAKRAVAASLSLPDALGNGTSCVVRDAPWRTLLTMTELVMSPRLRHPEEPAPAGVSKDAR